MVQMARAAGISAITALIALGCATAAPQLPACEPFVPDNDAAPTADRGPAEPGADTTALGERLVPPRLLNTRAVERELERQYPPDLREMGVGGVAHVWVQVTPTGEVHRSLLQRSSGRPALDQAALRVAEKFLFRPAHRGDCTVSVWSAFPITFSVS